MSEKKSVAVLAIAGFLLGAASLAAIVAERKHVQESCKDLRIAMDGGYFAIVETGGLKESSNLTIYQVHNRKRIKVDKIPVTLETNKEGYNTYAGERIKLVIHNKTQPSTGRQIASLQGEVNGEKVSATLSCAN